jgi:peptidoglycan/LPS O-acetylase OafA/YrhL
MSGFAESGETWSGAVKFSNTVKTQQEARKEFTSGFDYVRLVLASSVLMWHTVPLTQGMATAAAVGSGAWGTALNMILPMFFSLSGFLVSASLERSRSEVGFLYLRGLRILPALSLVVLISALLIGPTVTAWTMRDYFEGKTFFTYFMNLTGRIYDRLPGVFLGNPFPESVNGSLWTITYELDCYMVLAFLAVVGALKNRTVFLCIFAAMCVAEFYYIGMNPASPGGIHGKTLALFFFAGVVLRQWRDVIPYSIVMFATCLAVCVLVIGDKNLMYLAPLPVAYVTTYLGLTRPKRIPVILDGDYSYGIYIYAFPIQQIVVNVVTKDWRAHLVVSVILVGCFAAISWHYVEKPLQNYKIFARRMPTGAEILIAMRRLIARDERGRGRHGD